MINFLGYWLLNGSTQICKDSNISKFNFFVTSTLGENMIKTRNKNQSFFGYIWQCLEYTNLKFCKTHRFIWKIFLGVLELLFEKKQFFYNFKEEQFALTDCPGRIQYCFLMMRKIYDWSVMSHIFA